jgi:dipeptide/tripeptide permease
MAGWFLANSAGDKVAGMVAGLYGQIATSSFFMIFVVSSLVASGLLYLLVPRINRLTAGVRL